MGFDFNYRGNQNEIIAEALGVAPALERITMQEGNRLLGYEPVIQFALDDECKTQCRLGFETRTTAYQVKTGDYSEDQISVYLTVCRFDSLTSGEQFGDELLRIAQICEKMADEYLVENVLQPLKNAIALK